MGDERAVIAYFTNQYPAVSHTFIRREIAAVEAAGIRVERVSIRRPASAVVDPADKAEEEATTFLVETPKRRVVRDFVAAVVTRPVRTVRAFGRAIGMSRGAKAGAVRHVAYFIEAVVLERMMRERGVRHVHVHFGTNAAAVAVLMRELGGVTFSLTVHGPDELDDPVGLRMGEKIAAARFVCAISDYTRAQLMRWSDQADWDKIHVVRCTIDGAYAEAPAREVPGGEAVFVNVGRLSAQKGQLVLVDGFAEVLNRGHRARLVIVGDGELRTAVEDRVRAHGIGESVTLTGSLPEAGVREELSRAWALALPSSAEGLPMVIMEAFALGVPVISTYVAGIPELVRDGENGWLIPAGRADEVARAMEAVMGLPPERRREMGEAGRRAVLAQHDARTALDELIGMLREACG